MIPGLVSTPIHFVLSSLTKIKDDRGDTSTGLTAKNSETMQYTVWYIYSTLYPGTQPTVLPFILGAIPNTDKQTV